MLTHVNFVVNRNFKSVLVATLTIASLLFSAAFAQTRPAKLVTRQLIWPLEGATVFVNGNQFTSAFPQRTVDSRALLPLRELSKLLAISLEPVAGSPTAIRFGKLEIFPDLRLARVDGKQVSLNEIGGVLDGTLYVAVRVLDKAINASWSLDAIQRLITVTVSRSGDRARAPVARFSTDKREYRIGEPVKIVEYSYDPDGNGIVAERWTGKEEAYFSPGIKTLSLLVINNKGISSEVFTQQIKVVGDVLFSQRDYALRFFNIGRTFPDSDVLTYPTIAPFRDDDTTALLLSDSPEDPDRSGLMYEDTVNGAARLIAYHTNNASGTARLLVLATNLENFGVTTKINRFGETSATTVVATLGRASLLDFLTSQGRESLNLEPGQSAPLYFSNPLEPGQGLNLMFDLETSGRVQLSVFFIEENLIASSLPYVNTPEVLTTLRSLPALSRDPNHQRGTFYGAIRSLRLDLSRVSVQQPAKIIIGDGNMDQHLVGRDALTGDTMVLKGNFGVTYKISLENAIGTVGAIVPRGGPYAGAVRVNGAYTALPDSGVLYRKDLPILLYRALEGKLDNNRMELEFVPASGSYLPVNFLFYRVGGRDITLR
jgi:hypothetical protein